MGDEQADRAAALALLADAVAGQPRAATRQDGGDHAEQLVAVDRAAVELEVHLHMRRDGRRGVKGVNVLGVGIDDRGVLAGGGEVAKALDAPGGGTGSDGDELAGDATHLLYPLGVARGRDRPFHERQVVGTFHRRPRHLEEMGDAHGADQLKQLLLAVEDAELAAVAGGELPHRHGGTGSGLHSSGTESS